MLAGTGFFEYLYFLYLFAKNFVNSFPRAGYCISMQKYVLQTPLPNFMNPLNVISCYFHISSSQSYFSHSVFILKTCKTLLFLVFVHISSSVPCLSYYISVLNIQATYSSPSPTSLTPPPVPLSSAIFLATLLLSTSPTSPLK